MSFLVAACQRAGLTEDALLRGTSASNHIALAASAVDTASSSSCSSGASISNSSSNGPIANSSSDLVVSDHNIKMPLVYYCGTLYTVM